MDTDSLATVLVHADADEADLAIAPALYQTVPFASASAEEFAKLNSQPRPINFYRRYGNPTINRLERLMAKLEGAEAGLATASGVAAIATTVLAMTSAGDHIIGQKSMYGGTLALFDEIAPRLGIQTTLVHQVDVASFAEAITPNTKLMVLESPSNPLLQLTDLAAVSSLAREHGIVTLVDNTIATPVNQRPLDHGADLVMHSLTKGVSGHSDVLGGVVVGPQHLVDRIWRAHIVFGSVMSPFDAWLTLRGARTLDMRVRSQNKAALRVARFLERHPLVARVHFAGLESHPQHQLAQRQMHGYGSVLSFVLEGEDTAAKEFIARLRLPARSPSLGGVRSLVIQPAAMWAQDLTLDQLAAAGVPDGLVRLSLGLEDEEDLVADIEQALGAARRMTPRVASRAIADHV